MNVKLDVYKRYHWVKSVQIRVFFWSAFSRIRTWKNSVFGHFSSSVCLWKKKEFSWSMYGISLSFLFNIIAWNFFRLIIIILSLKLLAVEFKSLPKERKSFPLTVCLLNSYCIIIGKLQCQASLIKKYIVQEYIPSRQLHAQS